MLRQALMVAGLALCIGAFATAAHARGGDHNDDDDDGGNGGLFRAHFSGTIIDAAIDSDGTGFPANLTDAQARVYGFGRAKLRVLSEFELVGINTAACPDPGDGTENAELRLVTTPTSGELVQNSIWIFRDGSQLISNTTEGFACLNLTTGALETTSSGNFVGGTGRFEGATGEFVAEARGVNTLTAIQGLAGSNFGSITGTVEGVVTRMPSSYAIRR